MEKANITLASPKNAKKILSKKKDDSNFGSTAFNQLTIHHGAEKVVVTLSKSNLEESNKLDFLTIRQKN